MNILAFGASNSKSSINKALATHAAEVFHDEMMPNCNIELIDLNDYEMPLYSIDYEQEHGVPEAAQKFLDKIAESDALIISYAEHNGHYTVAFKNVFDWASRLNGKVFQGKPKVALSASPGKGGASSVLSAAASSAVFFDAKLVGQLSVPNFGETFDTEAGKLVDEDLAAELRSELQSLKDVLEG